jgi:hypothetical protein
MMLREFWRDHGRVAARHAASMTVSYAVCGFLWALAMFLPHPHDAEVPLELVLFLILASTVLIFACGVVTAALWSLLLPSTPEWWKTWRAGLAGLLFSIVLFSGALEKGADRLIRSSGSRLSFGNSMAEDLLLFLTPVALGISVSSLLAWLAPPWRRSRLR